MDIREFLEARLAEDEQAAHEVPEPCRSWSLAASATVFDGEDTWYVIDQRNALHIARHDPARVLRDVAAGRRLLDLSRLYMDAQFPDSDGGYSNAMDDVLSVLAATWSEHPDFDPSWAPGNVTPVS